jgi:hypothetical protein
MMRRKKILWIPARRGGKRDSSSLFQIFHSFLQLESLPYSYWQGGINQIVVMPAVVGGFPSQDPKQTRWIPD